MDRRVGPSWEDRERARIDQARERHEELRKRLLNPRVRLMGRDESALQLQINEKKERLERERLEDLEYRQYQERLAVEMKQAELQREEEQKQANREMRELWDRRAQEVRDRKKAELEEYHRIPRSVGVSSAQKFDGEDHCSQQRKILQQKQMQKWAQQQTEERRRKAEEEKMDDILYAESLKAYNEKLDDLEFAMHQEKMRTLQQDRELNSLLAQEKAQRSRNDGHLEAFKNEQDCNSLRFGEEQQENVLNPHRFRPDHFSGYSREKLEAIREDQRRQALEKQIQQQKEREFELEWGRKQNEFIQFAHHVANTNQEFRRNMEQHYSEAQKLQMQEKQAEREREREEARQSGFHNHFFNNFGKSHR